MGWLLILTVMLGGSISTVTAEFGDVDSCNAAGRAYQLRTVPKLEVLWECVEK